MTSIQLRKHEVEDQGPADLQDRPLSSFIASDALFSGSQRPTPLAHPQQGWIAGENSRAARQIQIRNREDGRLLAQALATPAEQSTLLSGSTAAASLKKCTLISDISFDDGLAERPMTALFYLALRRSRMEERPVVLAATSSPGPESVLLDLKGLPHLGEIEVDGSQYAVSAQRVDIAMHRVFTQTPEPMRDFLRDQFVPEAVDLLDRWTERFFQTPFFRSVRDGTLSKEQYIYSLSNMHQFVRWTTRLIGLAISHSQDKVIRHKWVDHLREEVDHEVIIEKDLAALGVDVDYVVNTMLPNVATQQFMVAQESAIAFHRDPVCFMASPFAAEGFAARLDRSFAEALRRAAASWGVENPKKCTVFWTSHLEFDGGDDGHYEHSLAVLRQCLNTDTDLLKFLNSARLAMQAMEIGYSSYIEDMAIFGPTN